MRIRNLHLNLVALTCAVPGLLLAALQADQARVQFFCNGPGGLRIEGRGSQLSVEDKGESLVVTVPLATVSTGIGVRDTHMHERYLESDKYPTAELMVARAELSFPADGAKLDGTANGAMSIHGTTRPVTFRYKAARTGSAYEVQGELDINMNDYGIPKPTFLGVTVKPAVYIWVAFRLAET